MDRFRTLSHFLNEEKLQYYIFRLPEDKPLLIVIRGLNPQTSTEDIKEELSYIGYPIRNVSWMRKGFPLVIVSLDNTEAARSIYDLTTCLGLIVKVETKY